MDIEKTRVNYEDKLDSQDLQYNRLKQNWKDLDMELAYAATKGPIMDRTVELKLKDVIHDLEDKICATNHRPKRAPPRDYDCENELRK